MFGIANTVHIYVWIVLFHLVTLKATFRQTLERLTNCGKKKAEHSLSEIITL